MIKYLPSTVLSAALMIANPVFSEETENHDVASIQYNKQAADSVEIESVQPMIDKEAEALRKSIVSDAVDAVVETNNALTALDQDKPNEAVAALKRAIGKLGVVLKRDPEMGLKPVHVSKTVKKLHTTPEVIVQKIDAAQMHLKQGELQQARHLLAPLVSEVTLTVTSLPLGTYSESIKAIVPLIDEGKFQEAKFALMSLLNTLVVKDFVTPLPPLLAEGLLDKAKTLAAKDNRTEEEGETLTHTLKAANDQLNISKLLGYSDDKFIQPLFDQLIKIDALKR